MKKKIRIFALLLVVAMLLSAFVLAVTQTCIVAKNVRPVRTGSMVLPVGYIALCNVSHRRFYALNKFGLATAVNPAEPVITAPFAPPLQWTISRLPSASVPPAMPTWESSG